LLGPSGIAAGLCLAVALLSPGRRSHAQGTAGATPTADTLDAIRLDSLLDLDAVVARALAVNPAVAQGEGGVRTAQSEKRVTTGAYLPTLSATSSVLRSDATLQPGLPGTPTSASSYSAGLAASMELFTGGRRGADRARAIADERAATASNVSQRFAVTLLAKRGFYEALRAADLVGVARARVTEAEHGLRYAQDRARSGTATRSDELRARLELTAGRQQLVAALDTLQTAAFALGRLVGSNGPIGARTPASLEPRALALSDSDVVRLAVESSPGVRAAEATANANEANTRAARTQYVPDVRVTGGYNWANQSLVIGAARPGWVLALGTTFPLFNGFQREDAVTRAEVAADVATVTAADERRLARAEAARLLGALRLAARNIVLAGEAVESAQEDLRVQTERYRAGISTTLDQLTSELALTQARLGLVAARYNYQVTRATLEALVGRTL
jgi:outer membrane protein TolC